MKTLLKTVKAKLYSKFEERRGLKRILVNINWLLLEKISFFFLSFLVGTVTFRYLGPQNVGKISYAESFVSLFAPLLTLGLEDVAIKELVDRKHEKNKIIGNVLLLKLFGGLLFLILSIGSSLVFNQNRLNTPLFVLILATGSLFKIFDVVNIWFRSEVKCKYSSLTRLISFAVISSLKLTAVLLAVSPLGFIILTALNSVLDAILYIYFYQAKAGSVLDWQLSLEYAKKFLSASWPLVISGLAISIYMRLDHILIRKLLDETHLGFYYAAVRIPTLAYFFPQIIAKSVFPAIISAKSRSADLYQNRLAFLNSSLTWISIFIAILISSLSGPIIKLIFGPKFSPASSVLSIYIWTLVFVSFGIIVSKQLVIEKRTVYTLAKTVTGAVVSIAANLALIPYLGIIGAAWSAVLAQAASNVISNVFFKETRHIFWQFIKSLNPLRTTKFVKQTLMNETV